MAAEPVGGVEGEKGVGVGDEHPAREHGFGEGGGLGGVEGVGLRWVDADEELGGHDAAGSGATGFAFGGGESVELGDGFGVGGEVFGVIKDRGEGVAILCPGAAREAARGFVRQNSAAAPFDRIGAGGTLVEAKEFGVGEQEFRGVAAVGEAVFALPKHRNRSHRK